MCAKERLFEEKYTSCHDMADGVWLYIKTRRLAAVMTSFQNEKLVIDALTGIIIDLNDFKSINDKYGHATARKNIMNPANSIADPIR